MSFPAPDNPTPGDSVAFELDGTPSGEDVSVETTDWGRVGALAAGIVIGAVIGAGAAMLLAPRSGPDTRKAMRRAARRGRKRAGDAWDHLGDELWWMARRKKKQARRGATRAGWFMEDLLDHVVGPLRGRGRPRPKDEPEEAERGARVVVEED